MFYDNGSQVHVQDKIGEKGRKEQAVAVSIVAAPFAGPNEAILLLLIRISGHSPVVTRV